MSENKDLKSIVLVLEGAGWPRVKDLALLSSAVDQVLGVPVADKTIDELLTSLPKVIQFKEIKADQLLKGKNRFDRRDIKQKMAKLPSPKGQRIRL